MSNLEQTNEITEKDINTRKELWTTLFLWIDFSRTEWKTKVYNKESQFLPLPKTFVDWQKHYTELFIQKHMELEQLINTFAGYFQQEIYPVLEGNEGDKTLLFRCKRLLDNKMVGEASSLFMDLLIFEVEYRQQQEFKEYLPRLNNIQFLDQRINNLWQADLEKMENGKLNYSVCQRFWFKWGEKIENQELVEEVNDYLKLWQQGKGTESEWKNTLNGFTERIEQFFDQSGQQNYFFQLGFIKQQDQNGIVIATQNRKGWDLTNPYLMLFWFHQKGNSPLSYRAYFVSDFEMVNPRNLYVGINLVEDWCWKNYLKSMNSPGTFIGDIHPIYKEKPLPLMPLGGIAAVLPASPKGLGRWQGELKLAYDPGGFLKRKFAEGVNFFEDMDKDFSDPDLGIQGITNLITYNIGNSEGYIGEEIRDEDITETDRNKGSNYHQRGHYFIFYEDGSTEHWMALYPMFQNSELADGHTHGAFILEFPKPVKYFWDIYTCIGCGAQDTPLFDALHANYRNGNSDSWDTIHKGLPFEPWFTEMGRATSPNYDLTVNGTVGRLGSQGDVWEGEKQAKPEERTFTRAYGFVPSGDTIRWRLGEVSIRYQKVPGHDDFGGLDWNPNPAPGSGNIDIPLGEIEIPTPEPGDGDTVPEDDFTPDPFDPGGGEPEIPPIEPDIPPDIDVPDNDTGQDVDPGDVEPPEIDPPEIDPNEPDPGQDPDPNDIDPGDVDPEGDDEDGD
ncbi:hypothetical protein [endosymbiont GvMRE of Glomus versiforme]|uniref:hypothetical protein n=1 Tax=endosymbiont GvMRE of Glomus versiforme TaxID=2039283 RepID=UPI000EDDAA87|nr:hypothetical protein [endosymbiont GvMRE of Glomus versiforme]RHZ35816.1 hypothetical protein GvMRE_Ic5g9 [endosymbiont GvMRE of Glomus versiforme]